MLLFGHCRGDGFLDIAQKVLPFIRIAKCQVCLTFYMLRLRFWLRLGRRCYFHVSCRCAVEVEVVGQRRVVIETHFLDGFRICGFVTGLGDHLIDRFE